MLLRFEAEPLVKLPCGCGMHGIEVHVDGRRLENVTGVTAEIGRPPLYAKRLLVWRVEMHTLDFAGKVVIKDGKPQVCTMIVMDEKPGDFELRCKHHPEYGS